MKMLSPLLSLLLVSAAFAADRPLDAGAVQKTAERSLKWLQDDMLTWRSEHECSACHHGPMYLWTMHVARRQGYSVDEPRLRELTNWLLTSDAARIFPKPPAAAVKQAGENSADKMTAAMMGRNNLSQPTIYLAHALNAMPPDDPARRLGWSKVARHFAAVQLDDGSFAGRKGWPPIFNSPQILTLFAATGTSGAIMDEPLASDANLRKSLERASGFLARQPADETHQGAVLWLLWHSRRTDSQPASAAGTASIRGNPDPAGLLVERLRKLQRSDGGWAQTADLKSDAFATGQTLYALRVAGLTSEDSAVRLGIEYLVRTQEDDGTWVMNSRPNPETGKPADFLNPITYAGAAWATLGITSHVPKR